MNFLQLSDFLKSSILKLSVKDTHYLGEMLLEKFLVFFFSSDIFEDIDNLLSPLPRW